MSESERIFNVINKKRIELGISKKELAEMIGCSERAIRYWELGERQMTIDAAAKALHALRISVRLGADE